MSFDKVETKVESRDFFECVIRPVSFDKRRIPSLERLATIITQQSVNIRGWDRPHIDVHNRIERDGDHIRQYVDWQHHKEVWKFYKSGQFVQKFGSLEDWKDESGFWPPGGNWSPGAGLGIASTLYTLLEIVLLASRLGQELPGNDDLYVRVSLTGPKGRVLYFEPGLHIHIWEDHPLDEAPFEVVRTYKRHDLLADPDSIAIELATSFFLAFGYQAQEMLMKDLISKLSKYKSGT